MHYDVVIAGGGIVGSATAYFLKKHGFTGSVAIIEKDLAFTYACTARSVGGIRQQFSTPENIALSTFGLRLIRNLKHEFGAEADVGFKEQGYLMLASPEGEAVLRENHAMQIEHGADNVLLDPGELGRKFPWLNTEGLALGCWGRSGEGFLDPYGMMGLLRKAAAARGVAVISGEITGVERGSRIEAVRLADGTRITCGTLVNAAGAGAGRLAAMAGIELPVGPRKRYVYVLDVQHTEQLLPKGPLLVDIAGFFFRPEGSLFLSGNSPSKEEEPQDMDWEVDHAWFEERIWPSLAHRVPACERLKVVNSWVGHYDYNALDQNGIFGRHPEARNFFFANGFSGHGFQQGPASGNAVAELIMFGEYRTIDLTRFDYARVLANAPLFERNII